MKSGYLGDKVSGVKKKNLSSSSCYFYTVCYRFMRQKTCENGLNHYSIIWGLIFFLKQLNYLLKYFLL